MALVIGLGMTDFEGGGSRFQPLYFVLHLIGVLWFQKQSYMLLHHSLLLNVLNFYRW